MPFRSETEPLREQIRRVEEQANELVDDRTALEQQLAEQKKAHGGLRAKLLVLAALASIGATTLVGFVAGDLAAEHRARTARQIREQRHGEERLRVVLVSRECSQLEAATKSELATCDQERATAKWQSTMPVAPGSGGLR